MILYKISQFLVRSYYHLLFRVRTEGIEHIPKDSSFVICSNHISLNDPPMLGSYLPIEMGYMAKEELFKNKLFGALISSLGAIPVKRDTSDLGAIKEAVRLIKNGKNLVVFPEGRRSTNGRLGQGKSGAVLIAIKAGVNILPVGISGSYRLFSKMTIRVGKPIELDKYFGKRLHSDELQKITDNQIMPIISKLSGAGTYEN